MADLNAQPAEVRMTLQIVRAATGKTETVELVGHVVPAPEPKPATPNEETDHGSHSQHGRP